jgi:DNA-directed RNA polymerase II subunit RPB1
MPSGFTSHTSDLETIVGVQFSVFSPEEIERRAVVEITSHATYEGTEPKIGGLFDPAMGVLDNGKTCRSCGQTNHGCPGHFGFYRLTRPVYFIQFLDTIMKVLRCVCIRCAKLKIDKELHKHLLAKKGEARWNEVLRICSEVKRCGQETEDGCGALQPSKYTREGIARIVAHFVEDKKQQQQPLEVEYVHRLFRRILDEDVDFMGLSRYWCRPDWMICTVLPIPPPQVRPSVVMDNNTRSEDDLTHKLFEIIKNDKTLQMKIDNNAQRSVTDELTNVVQYHVATLVNNKIPGVAPSAQRSGRPLKSIQQRIGSKEGRIRYNIQGKRVEFSARSVITPDPNLSIEELGVPLEIATNLTFPERVTAYNREKLYKLVQNGADTWPGAKTLVRADGRMVNLKHVNAKEIVLYNGDIVNRHLLDGDIVLFNRQPTLHKMSMMAHRVKVLPYKTFRLNVLVTRPYNADFDGDEMNAHIPQSYEAAVELEDIASIPQNIVSPRHARPLIGVFQDSCVGSYRLTRPGVEFTKREFMNLMMRVKRFDGTLPEPRGTNGHYTGQQVISQLLPSINLRMKNKSDGIVVIEQGDIKEGTLDSDVYMKSGKGIVHVTYNDYGPRETVALLDALQRVVEDSLILKGFSVGISDLVADEGTKLKMDESIRTQKQLIEQVQLQLHTDLFENNTGKTNQQEFEDQAFSILDKARDAAGKAGEESLSAENRLVAMVRSGSKGNASNIAQMIACLGQQAIDGKRIPYGLTDRTLPHYKKYDDGAEARGFIESSFIRGLTPQEFFFHSMTGREGLIDTAVKTADTGYIQRQLIKALEDIVVHHDGTVRDADMRVVQFAYGEDGIAAIKLEAQELHLARLSITDIEQQYGMVDVDWSTVLAEGTVRADETAIINSFVTLVKEDQRMLVEGVYNYSLLDAGSVNAPVNLARLLLNQKIRFGITGKEKTDLTPGHVCAGMQKILSRTNGARNRMWQALVRYTFAPHKLIVKDRLTKMAFDAMCDLVVVGHMKSWVQPGEQVGIVAAQSIGEPSTQLTLNTFHMAGVASKSNVNRGIPRLKELLKGTKKPKATSLTIYMKEEYKDSKEKARELVQDLELTLLRSITNKVAIYWDPTDDATVIPEDKELLEFYHLLEDTDEEADKSISKWLLRLELNREEMFNKNISVADVMYMIRAAHTENISIVYNDYNSDRLVVRIRIPTGDDAKEARGPLDTQLRMDDLTALKRFQNKLLNHTVIRGIPGIKAVTFRQDKQKVVMKDGKYETVTQYILDTDGSNYIQVMNHPAVDANKLYTTNVYDVMEILGLEAVRAVLHSEIAPVFASEYVNYRHIGLLVDCMLTSGRFMSIDRYGINKNNIGALAKMSFEETSKVMIKAATFGDVDPVTGVSANIMTGQPFRGGTAFSQILLDDDALQMLQQGLTLDKEDEEETGDLTALLDEGTGDPCGAVQFQMNLQRPAAEVPGGLPEPDVEIYMIGE